MVWSDLIQSDLVQYQLINTIKTGCVNSLFFFTLLASQPAITFKDISEAE